jgi:hypothetical protein
VSTVGTRRQNSWQGAIFRLVMYARWMPRCNMLNLLHPIFKSVAMG